MYSAIARPAITADTLNLFFSSLFDFFAVLYLVNKDFGRFKTGYKMLVDYQGSIPRNVPGDFALALFIDKAPETANVYIVTIGHGILHHAKKRLNRCGHVSLVHAGLFCDFVDYICFSHFVIF